MNFLEAHKIVHDFARVVGQSCEHKDDFFLSIERLPFKFDKDRIVSAFQIFIYHMVFFRTRTQEEYQHYYLLYQSNINRFLQYSEILKFRKYNKIIFNKNPLYQAFNKKKINNTRDLYKQFIEKNYGLVPYRIDDIFGANLKEMEEYRQELLKDIQEKNDEEIFDAYDRAIETYAKKTYEKANIEWEDDYFYYFQDFNTLRKALNNKKYEKYYLKYMDYIQSNR